MFYSVSGIEASRLKDVTIVKPERRIGNIFLNIFKNMQIHTQKNDFFPWYCINMFFQIFNQPRTLAEDEEDPDDGLSIINNMLVLPEITD